VKVQGALYSYFLPQAGSLRHGEPITDRPFRETNATTCFSTEF
jgi:hypothetical protein